MLTQHRQGSVDTPQEIDADAVGRRIRAALDSLQHDMTCTSKVLAVGELREALRLLEEGGEDAAGDADRVVV
jgi:hypothetical protein